MKVRNYPIFNKIHFMTDINKIIRTLDLAQSDAREETLSGIIKYIIYISSGDVFEEEIQKQIKKDFSLEIHKSEIVECIASLVANGHIEKSQNNVLKLVSDENQRIRKENLKIHENRQEREKVFRKNILEIAEKKDIALDDKDIELLWSTFRTFIYECYLTHGKNAISNLTNQEYDDDNDINQLVKKYAKELENKSLKRIFLKYVKLYPSLVDSKILEYLTELANKTEAFYALGLSQEDYSKIYENIKFDWIIFVDTNFLYSILELHGHPENAASIAVLGLGTEMGIKFSYLSKTYEELSSKKNDFDKYLEKDLKPNQIRALLKSDKLDNFARSYYEQKLKDFNNTPHPSDILIHSQNNLKNKKLTIYQSKFEQMTKNENYLLDEESAYGDFLAMMDDVRRSKGLQAKGRKEPIHIEHDIFLREAIMWMRSKDAITMSDAKYFGVTLDKSLIKFDSHRSRKKGHGEIIPTFFKPSLLLKKLLKYSPVKSENYLRAFISTISTPAIDENINTSKPAIRSVKYFHKMGIDSERLILDCLKDELFLKSFEAKENSPEELGEFFEFEINKQIANKVKELEDLENKSRSNAKKIEKLSGSTIEANKENLKLTDRVSNLEKSLKLYQNALKTLKKKETQISIQKPTIQLTIDDEKSKVEVEGHKTKSIMLEDILIQKKLKKRKNIGYFYLFCAISLFFILLLIFTFQTENWNFVAKLVDGLEALSETRRSIAISILTVFLSFFDFLLIKGFYKHVFDEKSKQDFIDASRKRLNEV